MPTTMNAPNRKTRWRLVAFTEDSYEIMTRFWLRRFIDFTSKKIKNHSATNRTNFLYAKKRYKLVRLPINHCKNAIPRHNRVFLGPAVPLYDGRTGPLHHPGFEPQTTQWVCSSRRTHPTWKLQLPSASYLHQGRGSTGKSVSPKQNQDTGIW